MRLTVVGCAGSFPGPESPASCYLLEADGFRVVIDFGNGSLGALQKYTGLFDVDAVCLSHLHADHCVDLYSYSIARTYSPAGPQPAIPVYGPARTAERMGFIHGLDGDDLGLMKRFTFQTLEPGHLVIGPFDVQLVHVNHPVETFAFRFSYGGRSLVYTGDTGETEAVPELAAGADVFLSEAAFLEGPGLPPGIHLTARQAGAYANRAGTGKLVLTHLVPGNSPDDARAEAASEFPGDSDIAVAGQVIEVLAVFPALTVLVPLAAARSGPLSFPRRSVFPALASGALYPPPSLVTAKLVPHFTAAGVQSAARLRLALSGTGSGAVRPGKLAGMTRPDGRAADALRPVRFTRGWLDHAEGSVLVEFGKTRVLCAASVTEEVPRWRRGSGLGWVTAEYAMLPRATNTRNDRESVKGRIGGRTHEISRLVGRSLRACVDYKALGENTIVIDCDVLQADGGTRTAAVTGGYVALVDAIDWLRKRGKLKGSPLVTSVAAVSVGIVNGEPRLDLCYEEDSTAETDMNVVCTGTGDFVEIQGTAEGEPFSRTLLNSLLDLGTVGCAELTRRQNVALQTETIGGS